MASRRHRFNPFHTDRPNDTPVQEHDQLVRTSSTTIQLIGTASMRNRLRADLRGLTDRELDIMFSIATANDADITSE